MHITFCIIVTTLHTVHISAYVHVALAVSSYEDVSKKTKLYPCQSNIGIQNLCYSGK